MAKFEGTPAKPEDAMSTIQIIKRYFALHMELDINDLQLPDGTSNKAFVAFTLADSRLARADEMLTESTVITEQFERAGPQLQSYAKGDEKALTTINTNLNRLQQQHEQLKKLEVEIEKLIVEKPSVFREALTSIRNGYEKEKMTKIELDRHNKTLDLIAQKFKQANTLSASIKECGDVLDDYYKMYEQAKAPGRKREEPATTPNQPTPGTGKA